MTPAKLEIREDFESLVERHDTFLFDCDGVIWSGSTVIDGVPAALDMLRRRGKRLIFVSNNSSTSRKDYVAKFSKLGIQASVEEIFSSAYATAVYLREVVGFSADKKVYVIGGSGIHRELEEVGIKTLGSDDVAPISVATLGDILPNLKSALLCLLACAHTHLTHDPDCLFIATNDDRTLPGGKYQYPGCGSLLSSLVHSTQRTPLVMGKPNQPMLDCVMQKFHLDPARTCMVGDRLDTDIRFGIKGGLSTLCVLTGVANEADVLSSSEPKATYYMSSFGDLSKLDQ
ncbi:4-nitrophenylphosphatase [Coemansia spiralis]|nr:4-nitrophenylphosphatase [Coemansia spiralis]